MLSAILEILDSSEEDVLRLQRQLVAIPALGPTNGGQGETQKVEFLQHYLDQFPGTTTELIAAPDHRVECGFRPSVVIRRPGKTSRTLWLIAHTDVVPVGDLGLWTGDPFVLRRDGDTLMGRGVEDNHQGMVSALLLLRALELSAAQPDLTLGIILVADEETGNALGMEYIMTHHANLFAPDDLVLIPDFGTPQGDAIEIAEKSVLWLKFTVHGKQCHASTPEQGVNSLFASSALIIELDALHHAFARHDPLFDPPTSTFAPTKKEANVPNINTIPGQDVFYLDCRVLPDYPLDDVERMVRRICDTIENRFGVRINFTPVVREQAAAGTSPDSAVVRALLTAISAVHGRPPRLIGIGGGTVAACLRKRGIPAVCWSTLNNTAHQPDESSSIANTLADAKTFARILFATTRSDHDHSIHSRTV